jgi:hypothetical protein
MVGATFAAPTRKANIDDRPGANPVNVAVEIIARDEQLGWPGGAADQGEVLLIASIWKTGESRRSKARVRQAASLTAKRKPDE